MLPSAAAKMSPDSYFFSQFAIRAGDKRGFDLLVKEQYSDVVMTKAGWHWNA